MSGAPVPVRLRGPGRAVAAWLLAVPPIYLQLEAQKFQPPARNVAVVTATMIVSVLHHRTRAALDGVVLVVGLALAWCWIEPVREPRWEALALAGVALLVVIGARIAISAEEPSAVGLLVLLGGLSAAAFAVLVAKSEPVAATKAIGVVVGLPATVAIGTGATVRRWGHDPVGWPVLVPALGAAWWTFHVLGLAVPAAMAALGLAVAAVLAIASGGDGRVIAALRRAGRPLDRLLAVVDRLAEHVAPRIGRGFHALVRAAAAVALALTWLLVVLLPWLVQRVGRWRALDHPSAPGTRWVRVGTGTARTDRSWSPESAPAPDRARLARRRLPYTLASGVVVLGLIAGAVALYRRATAEQPEGTATELAGEQFDLVGEEEVALFAGTELPEHSSKGLNVHDGQRKTWRPPLARCAPRIVLWMFGGSAAFGWDQRDDRTVASALAKLAHDDGIDLEIHNYSVPGDVAFQQHRRLQRELALAEEPPDLVVSYDGFNDALAQSMAPDGTEPSRTEAFRSLLDNDVLPMVPRIRQSEDDDGRWHFVLDERVVHKPARGFVDGAKAASFQYRTAIGWTRDLLRREHIPYVDYFQPSQPLRARPVEGEPELSPDSVRGLRQLRRSLPRGTVDLSGALDREERPVYVDQVHMDERGAAVVAAAMYRDLRTRFDLPALEEVPRPCR